MSELEGPRDPPRGLGPTLRRLGPGMVIAGSIVGSGELVATTKVGAQAGFTLLWVIVLGCVLKLFTQVELGRAAVLRGRTALEVLDELPGPRLRVGWAVWAWLAMTVFTFAQLGGIVGGVAQALSIARPITVEGREWHADSDALARCQVELSLLGRGIDPGPGARPKRELEREVARLEGELGAPPNDDVIWTWILAVPTALMLAVGRYGLVQAVATAIVAVFTAITLLTLVLLQLQPDWAVSGGELARGLAFRLPRAVGDVAPLATAFAAFGIIGVGSSELVMYPYWCLEKGYARWTGVRGGTPGWTARARGWLRVLQVDAWLSLAVYTTATVAFFLLGAAVLHRAGLDPDDGRLVRTLAQMYVPVFGEWAHGLFLFGAFAVLYSTFFVASAGLARVCSDALVLIGLVADDPRARVRWVRVFSGVFPLSMAAIFTFVQAPVRLVLIGGVAQALLLPVLAGAALFQRHRRTPPELAPGRAWDLALWLSALAFLAVGVGGLIALS